MTDPAVRGELVPLALDRYDLCLEDEGARIKLLERDMVMATLLAESETFVLANRPETRVRSSRNPSRVER